MAAFKKSTSVVLSLKTLTPQEHLVLSAMRKLNVPSTAATVANFIRDVNEEEAEQLAVPDFVKSADEAAVNAVLTKFCDGAWASWFNNSKGKVFNLTSSVDKSIQASKAAARYESVKTEAQLQQSVIGAMIRLHRSSGEISLPIQKYIAFHHLTCLVQMPAGQLGGRLRAWVQEGTRFGPFVLKLPGFEGEVSATLGSYTLSDDREVYRLNVSAVKSSDTTKSTPVHASIAATATPRFKGRCTMSRLHPDLTEEDLVRMYNNGGNSGAAEGAFDII